MRRRGTDVIGTALADGMKPPADMLRCYIPDWVRASEVEEHDFTDRCQCAPTGSSGDCAWHLWFIGHRRWEAMREAWVAEHGLADSQRQWKVWPMRRGPWPKRTDFTGEDGRFCDAVDALDQDSRYLKLLVRN